MTRLGQMIVEDGKAQGITIGKAQGIIIGKRQGIEIGRKEMAQLVEKLLSANRENDCLKAATDDEYCEELLKEFGII